MLILNSTVIQDGVDENLMRIIDDYVYKKIKDNMDQISILDLAKICLFT